jgi:26S proteasome regulatory subunit N6
MILDKVLLGTLDQGAGCLEVHAPPAAPGVFPDSLAVIDSLGGVVDALFARSQKIAAS